MFLRLLVDCVRVEAPILWGTGVNKANRIAITPNPIRTYTPFRSQIRAAPPSFMIDLPLQQSASNSGLCFFGGAGSGGASAVMAAASFGTLTLCPHFGQTTSLPANSGAASHCVLH